MNSTKNNHRTILEQEKKLKRAVMLLGMAALNSLVSQTANISWQFFLIYSVFNSLRSFNSCFSVLIQTPFSCPQTVRQIAATISGMDNPGAEDQDLVTVHDYEGTSTPTDSDGDTSSPVLFREFVESGMLSLDKVEERENDVVIKNISEEVVIFYGEGTHVVAVHKILYTGLLTQVRLECFQSFRQAVAARRGGDANVQYGWYGGSRAEICDILRYGFGRCGIFDKGLSHGVGVYLSPENNPVDSILRTKEDENGIRHMLLCRIILGRTETIRAGSEQVYPSSTNFDSGVDHPQTPSTYIIWSAYMNSHILPVSIFSFKEPSVPQEYKIDRSELFRRLRSFAGDDVIVFGSKIL
ncbi:hypothetical protein CASFOL_003737 [Castilleja foliolosa]|uniref:PARP catalytic domain-containing protein n=1 Tax=Castilleja foliolosa TaxID=1961234 RepID=A0ABD3ELB5_9LAMI